ncbi:MAG TPA: aldo/keto reductase, partial [Solirubrobacteraceae bacterium]|nr:aldo/keto reductase [Solirubrobacteraceae bacterium]
TEANFRAVDEARAVADELGASVAQVALAWLLAQPGITAPIIGPRTLEQLEDLLPAAELTLDDDQLTRLGRWTAPARGYPERMNIEQNGIDVGGIRLRR